MPPSLGSCPRLTPHLRSLQFGTTPPLPRACSSPAHPGPNRPASLRGPGEGVPLPTSFSPPGLDSLTRPPLHSTAGTGAAKPGSSCLLFRVGWQRPGGPVGRVRVGERRVGSASSWRPSLSCGPAPSEREPSALGEAGHS